MLSAALGRVEPDRGGDAGTGPAINLGFSRLYSRQDFNRKGCYGNGNRLVLLAQALHLP